MSQKNHALKVNFIYVSKTLTTNPDGKSWETSFNTIQDAVNVASDYYDDINWPEDKILVAKGEYKEKINIMNKNIHMHGGFDGSETIYEYHDLNERKTKFSEQLNNRNSGNETIISTTLYLEFNKEVDNTASLLDGFKLTKGVNCKLSSLLKNGFALDIKNTVIESSRIYITNARNTQNSKLILENVTIKNYSGFRDSDSAIGADVKHILIKDSTIENNERILYNYMDEATLTLERTTIQNNSKGLVLGGDNAELKINTSIIKDNSDAWDVKKGNINVIGSAMNVMLSFQDYSGK